MVIQFYDQKKLDNILLQLDGTENKSVLGGNTTIAVSMATIKLQLNLKKKNFGNILIHQIKFITSYSTGSNLWWWSSCQ